MTLRAWKILAGLVLLFALGVVSGGALVLKSRGWARWQRTPATDAWSERWFAQMAEKLALREDQRTQMRPMVEQLQKELRELQQHTAKRTGEIIQQRGKEMWDLLDAAQREKYRALQEEQKLHRAATAGQLP